MYALRLLLIQQALKKSSGNISYPGLIAAWSAKGKSNDDEDRATLKDLTGNGHDITLNGFAFSKMSGYGGYNVGESNGWGAYVNWQNKYDLYEFSHNKIHIKGCKSSWEISKLIQASNCIWESFKIKLTRNKPSIKIQYRYIDETGTVRENNYLKDGINIIPKSYNLKEGSNNPSLGIFGFTTFYTDPDFECTIELIPEYPDALVFDGVDDYGINKNMPILEDYTIIAKRIHTPSKKTEAFISKTIKGIEGEFVFELYSTLYIAYSFGEHTSITYNNNVTYQTKLSYNGKAINVGNTDGGRNFIIGKRNMENDFYTGVFYSAYLFDRSLDEQEIKAFIRKYINPEYLLPSEIPTPDCYYDFSQGSNDDADRNTIKDYSDNGNDSVAHNFAFSGMSGYGGYPINPHSFNLNHSMRAVYTKTYNKIKVTKVKQIYNFTEKANGLNGFKIKVTGLTSDLVLSFNSGVNNLFKIDITTDGIYEMPDSTNYTYLGFKFNKVVDSCDVTIEFLPQYEGALVFDGVDDYISLDAFDSGFKTVFMVCKPFKTSTVLYDQRTPGIQNQFAFFNQYNLIAYSERKSVINYINGKINTELKCGELINKKHLIVGGATELNNFIPKIGCTTAADSYYTNIALYKFLGFKEALTEEQIQAVIKKYNLLDGVDEIEVN